jgi:hypothetical protein
MSRRRKHLLGKPEARTLRVLAGTAPDAEYLRSANEPERLRFQQFWRQDVTPNRLAEIIQAAHGAAIFCDSTVFLGHTPQVIWQSLLRPNGIKLVPAIFREIQPWLKDPRGVNVAAHAAIAPTIGVPTVEGPAVIFGTQDQELTVACHYYINLLGLRKEFLDLIRLRLAHELGRPARQQEVNNYCQQVAGSRALLIGRQGENAKNPENIYNDESLVVIAILYALLFGQEVVVLTADEAILEQFRKAIWLIETHYRSMLLADQYARDPFSFQTQRADNQPGTAFEGKSVLLLRKPDNLDTLLPRRFSPVRVTVAHVEGGYKQITQLMFVFEREMLRLFRIKGRTGGLSTELLDGRNCHVFLGDEMVEKIGNWAAIAVDATTERLDYGCRLALIDTQLALMSDEHISHIRLCDPRIHLPSQHVGMVTGRMR